MIGEQRTKRPDTEGEVTAFDRIDAHAHYVPAEYQAVLVPTGPDHRGLQAWNVPMALLVMDTDGIALGDALDGELKRPGL